MSVFRCRLLVQRGHRTLTFRLSKADTVRSFPSQMIRQSRLPPLAMAARASSANVFILYARDELKGPSGEILATGQNSIIMDMNSFVFVSKKKIRKLGGAVFSFSATLPIANNSLTSDVEGALSGGGGFADSYYQPLILGWRTKRADIRATYGFLAPTGRFSANANNNVGSGYWTQTASAGETFYLTKNKATSVSAFEMYEFHRPSRAQTFTLVRILTSTIR